MGLNQIIINLHKLLSYNKSQQMTRTETLKDLLEQLEIKQRKYTLRLQNTNDPKEIKRLNQRIKVCKAQFKKGWNTLKTLKEEASE